MRLIVEQNLKTAKYWLTQEISEEEREMWMKMVKQCERILKEEAGVSSSVEDFRKTELGEQIERFWDLMQWHGQRRKSPHPKEKPEIMGLRLFEALGQNDMMTDFFRWKVRA